LWWVSIVSGGKEKELVETDARSITQDMIINQVINRFPEAVGAFHQFNIDSCCGGSRTIAQAAKEDKANLADLMVDLNNIIAQRGEKE
jgi:iron-sulfur cluster repair protein YtfE (RIC family)